MKEVVVNNIYQAAELLGNNLAIPENAWSEQMRVGPQTAEAAKQGKIARASLVRYPFRNYYVIDIVLKVNLDSGWISIMSVGFLDDPNLPLQFTRIEKRNGKVNFVKI